MMKDHYYSAGYLSQLLQSDVLHVRIAAEECHVQPAYWQNDIDFYASGDVRKIQEHLAAEHNKQVTR